MGYLWFMGGPAEGLPIYLGGVLWELRRVAQRLRGLYGLDDASALELVLTGEAPLLPQIVAETKNAFDFPAATRIVLRIDPRVSGRQLERQYRQYRRQLSGDRDREMSTEKMELAVFVAEANDGTKRWNEVMEAWNTSGPGLTKYEDIHRFIRDAGRAFEAITGTKLKWQKRIPPSHLREEKPSGRAK